MGDVQPVEADLWIEYDEAGNRVGVTSDPESEVEGDLRIERVIVLRPNAARWGIGSFWMPLPTEFPRDEALEVDGR